MYISKKVVFFLALILISTSVIAQANPIIPIRWQGTYGGNSEYPPTFTIHSNGTVSWSGHNVPDGSISGVTIENGGGILASGAIIGDWIYLVIDGRRHGIIINLTQDFGGWTGLIGMGNFGASFIIDMLENYGVTFAPEPNTSNLPNTTVTGNGFWTAK